MAYCLLGVGRLLLFCLVYLCVRDCFFSALTVLSDANKVYFFFPNLCALRFLLLYHSQPELVCCHTKWREERDLGCYFSVTLKCQLWGSEVGLGVYILYGKFSLSGMLTIFCHEWMLDLITLFSVSVALIIHVFSSLIRWTASIDFQMFNLPSIPLGYNE